MSGPLRVEASAPATVANLGPGFDILGLALSQPADRVVAAFAETPGVHIAEITGDDGRLTRDPAKNTAGVAAAYVLRQLGKTDVGVRLTVHKGLPLASGMGSSAASAVAGAMAVNALLGEPLRREELLAASIEGEAAVSGRHADNVAPALFGGIVLVGGLTPDLIYPLPVPDNLYLATVTPAIAVPTAEARAVLPQQIPLGTVVRQTAGVALLMAALYRGDLALLGRAAEQDVIVEPARAHLMRGLPEVRAAAAAAGAAGTIISGAGPTLLSFCAGADVADRVAAAMRGVYAEIGLGARAQVARVLTGGASWRAI